ncbi:MAG: FKBP-type peptidyl-prolyl cis-trans isomerase [Longimicrobiales bacterium]
MTEQAKRGDTVAVHYTGKLDDGQVFDTSRDRDPIEFEVGAGQVIPGFESAVEGMEVGETRETRVTAPDAYGTRREELVVDVPRSRLPEGLEPAVGQQLAVRTADGQEAPGRIADVADEKIRLDLNHPLAGQDLNFELELVEIR